MSKLIQLILFLTLVGCDGPESGDSTTGLQCFEDSICEMQCYIDHDYDQCFNNAIIGGVSPSICDPILNDLESCLERNI